MPTAERMAIHILGGQAVGVPSFLSSSTYRTSQSTKITHPPSTLSMVGCRLGASLRIVSCSAVQESSAAASAAGPTTIPSTNGPAVSVDSKEAEAAPKEAASKPKKPAKAPAKPLPQLMEEEVIPPLKEILQAQDDLTELELTFQDNRLEGTFRKKGNPYSFWAFFPTGDLTGPKGFSISSYGSEASTVEPFLVDEKKVTANHVIFWVEKRLAAQGIIPVWKE